LIGLLACNQNNEQAAEDQLDTLYPEKKTSTDLLQPKVAAWVQQHADDPTGYQPLDFQVIDTVTFRQETKWVYKQMELTGNQKGMAATQKMLDSIARTPDPDRVHYVRYWHHCWLKNKNGVLEKTQLLVEASPDLAIVAVSRVEPGKEMISFQ
jgi:hypothetical protein